MADLFDIVVAKKLAGSSGGGGGGGSSDFSTASVTFVCSTTGGSFTIYSMPFVINDSILVKTVWAEDGYSIVADLPLYKGKLYIPMTSFDGLTDNPILTGDLTFVRVDEDWHLLITGDGTFTCAGSI